MTPRTRRLKTQKAGRVRNEVNTKLWQDMELGRRTESARTRPRQHANSRNRSKARANAGCRIHEGFREAHLVGAHESIAIRNASGQEIKGERGVWFRRPVGASC